MAHSNTLLPIANPVIDVVGESELVIVPLPEINVQAPAPTVALLAAIIALGLEIQIVWFGPAFETVGTWLTVMVTFETEATQGKFVIVQAKTFEPNPKPVMDVVGDNELVITPLPEIKVQAPVPTVAALAAMTALDVIQII